MDTNARKPLLGECILTLPEVVSKIGLGKSAIYDLINKGKFPRPLRLTAQRRGWPASEIDAWLEHLRSERDADVR
jgi:prophage regulatory protein